MISDVLSEAADDIRDYQRQFPDYESMSQELSVLLTLMDAVRLALDTPPHPDLVGSVEGLLTAVRRVDVAGVIAARQGFHATCEAGGCGTKADHQRRLAHDTHEPAKDNMSETTDDIDPAYLKMERRYDKVGVEVTHAEWTVGGEPVATGFRCLECGTAFLPAAQRIRNRHRCPNDCNAHLPL